MKFNFVVNSLFKKGFIVSVPLISFIITGCDDNIKSVKSTVYSSLNSTLNIGDAFKSRSDCIDGKWEEKKDNRERIIVSYECSLPEKYIDFYNKKQIKEISYSYMADEQIAKSQIESIQNQLANYQNIKKSLNSNKKDIAEVIEKSVRYKNTYSNQSGGEPGELIEAMQYGKERDIKKAEFCEFISEKYFKDTEELNSERCNLLFNIHSSYVRVVEKSNMNDENRYKYIDYPIMKSLPTWADNDVSSKASVEKYYKQNEKILDDMERGILNATKKIKIYNDIKENIKSYRKKLEDNISLTKTISTTQWYVTKTGGVELIDSYLTFYLADNEYKYTFQNPLIAIEVALHDFSDDQIPSVYISSMESYFNNLKRSLKFDVRGECRNQIMPC